MKVMKKLRRILGIIYRNLKFTFFEEIRRELFPPRIAKNENNKIYIHLGCGPVNSPEFINVDIMPYSHIHYIRKVEDLSIFPDEYADLIYACHILEHISHNRVVDVLKEWCRVLKKGGILRLSVPDFDKLIEVYLSEGKDLDSIIGPLVGGQDNPYNYHYSVFNEALLKKLLISAGFKEVREWSPDRVELHNFEDWASRPIKRDKKDYFISLNLEAIK